MGLHALTFDRFESAFNPRDKLNRPLWQGYKRIEQPPAVSPTPVVIAKRKIITTEGSDTFSSSSETSVPPIQQVVIPQPVVTQPMPEIKIERKITYLTPRQQMEERLRKSRLHDKHKEQHKQREKHRMRRMHR